SMASVGGLPGSGTGFSASFNTNGTVSADVSMDVIGDLVPGFDNVTDFLDRVGVDLGTGSGVSLSVNAEEGSFAFDINGIRGSANSTTGEVSFGGLSVGAGISLELSDVTINTQTGKVSAEVAAGVGVGAAGIEVGVDLVGGSFAYDPENNGRITITQSVGIEAANLEAEVVLDRNSQGIYTPTSVTFTPFVDTELASDIAEGLTAAYSEGTELGRNALDEIKKTAGANMDSARELARALKGAGSDTADLLSQSAALAGDELGNFLSAASDAGGGLSDLISMTKELSGNNRLNFLAAAAEKGSNTGAFISNFKSLLGGVKAISGFASLSVNQQGGISASVNLGSAGNTQLSFSRKNGQITGTGSLSLGGFGFSNAEVTFGSSGKLTGIKGSAKIKTPGFKIFGKKIGSKSLNFSLGMKNGKITASAGFSFNIPFVGRRSVNFTLGSGGLKRS
ncbi:MAG: hypothetical protein ACYTFY_22240, partial [Planctomycetota bacterium]